MWGFVLQMKQILNHEFDDRLSDYAIIDCRYPYEYNGGHIKVTAQAVRAVITHRLFKNWSLLCNVYNLIQFDHLMLICPSLWLERNYLTLQLETLHLKALGNGL